MCALLVGGSAFAALSPKYADWAKGPEQWLMTKDDWNAWRNVKTDEEAERFIELFWARRDPTPGTFVNEFRDRFNERVLYADAHFQSYRGKRGSLTSPGRVFILLGRPNATGSRPLIAPSAGGNGALGATEPGRLEWRYANPREIGLSGSVVCFSDITSREFDCDPRLGSLANALAQAIDGAVVNPTLTAVPDWAKFGANR
jgi:GWxTD domain-containing protein